MEELDAKIILSLAENRINASEVARRLFMHRNTVTYHTDKVKRTTGLDPLDFYDLHELVNMIKGEEKMGGDGNGTAQV